jgi:hypothetical protein
MSVSNPTKEEMEQWSELVANFWDTVRDSMADKAPDMACGAITLRMGINDQTA